jgi:hypothetical protein
MDRSYWASQKIFHLLWNLKVYYYVYKSLPLGPIQNQIYLIHTLPPYFSVITSDIILSSMPSFTK